MKSIISFISMILLCTTLSSMHASMTTETIISSPTLSPERIEQITQAVTLFSESMKALSSAFKETTPHVMKVGSLNFAGLLCSCSGIYVLVKGIQQSCSNSNEQENIVEDEDENRSLLQRCLNTLTNSSAKNVYQSGSGLALFVAGLITIAKSEHLLLLCA